MLSNKIGNLKNHQKILRQFIWWDMIEIWVGLTFIVPSFLIYIGHIGEHFSKLEHSFLIVNTQLKL